MAEEEAGEEGGEAAGEEEKKGLPIKLILIVVGVLALAGGGYFAYTNFFQEEAVEESAEKDKNGEEGGEGADGENAEELPPVQCRLHWHKVLRQCFELRSASPSPHYLA